MGISPQILEEKQAGKGEELHIAMFPWLAFGHLMPYLHLSKSLITSTAGGHRKIKVSFLSPPRNLARLPPIPPDLSSQLQYVPLTLPKTVDGLPAEAEATVDIPPEKTDLLRLAADRLDEPLSSFLEAAAPDVIIFDFFFHWLPPLARRHGVRPLFLTAFLASYLIYSAPEAEKLGWPASAADLTSPPPWVPFPTCIGSLPFEAEYVYIHHLPNSTGISDVARTRTAITGSDAILVRTSTELESDFLQLLSELHKKPAVPVGMLLPDESSSSRGGSRVLDWLDGRPAGSTVYVAFGTEVVLEPDQLFELAMGLEISEVPFIWALRDGLQSLPVGFEDRVMGRGMVCTEWVPQLQVLAHDSVGAFLTHCGLSSTIEGVGRGKPLVGLPIRIDQGLICRAMVGKGLGVEVSRDEKSGAFTRDDVAKAVRMALVEETSGPLKANSQEMKKAFSSEDWNQGYVDKLVHFLEDLVDKKDTNIIELSK